MVWYRKLWQKRNYLTPGCLNWERHFIKSLKNSLNGETMGHGGTGSVWALEAEKLIYPQTDRSLNPYGNGGCVSRDNGGNQSCVLAHMYHQARGYHQVRSLWSQWRERNRKGTSWEDVMTFSGVQCSHLDWGELKKMLTHQEPSLFSVAESHRVQGGMLFMRWKRRWWVWKEVVCKELYQLIEEKRKRKPRGLSRTLKQKHTKLHMRLEFTGEANRQEANADSVEALKPDTRFTKRVKRVKGEGCSVRESTGDSSRKGKQLVPQPWESSNTSNSRCTDRGKEHP